MIEGIARLVVNEYGEVATRVGDREYIHDRHPDPTPEQIASAKRRGDVRDIAWEETCGLDMSFADFEAKLAEIKASVPRGCRRSLHVSMETEYAYGDSTTTFRVTYVRPETDEEWADRRDLIERLAARAERERAEANKRQMEIMEAAFASGGP